MGRLQNNPSIGWVHPKSTHVCPLAWGNNKIHKKLKPFLPWAPSPRAPLLKTKSLELLGAYCITSLVEQNF